MYKRLRIRNFRSLKDLLLDNVGRVNLFVGANNVGKTSVLEAAWLFQGPGRPSLTMNISAFRSLDPGPQGTDLIWYWLFHNLKADHPIEIEGQELNGLERCLRITMSKAPIEPIRPESEKATAESLAQTAGSTGMLGEVLTYEYRIGNEEPIITSMSPTAIEVQLNPRVSRPPSILLSARRGTNAKELAERFTRVQDAEGLQPLVESLRLLEPRLTGLSLGYTEDRPLIRGHVGLTRPVPLSLLGGGAVRLTEILLAVMTAQEGLVLIDEIENGLYYGQLQKAWKAIDFASRASKAQVFATTHSLECASAAVSAFEDSLPKDFRLHRLERKKDGVRVVTYEHKKARIALDLNLEVR